MRGSRSRITLSLFIVLLSCFLANSAFSGPYRYAFGLEDRDPFLPLVSKNGTILVPREIDPGGLIIKGIIYSEETPVAVINDEVLEKGDSIGEYLVLEIEEKKVILKKGKEEFILKLEEEE